MLSGWGEFALAFALFVASHAIPARPAVRARLVSAIGTPSYIALYSAVSLALLYWLIGAAARAPYVELWGFARWQIGVPHAAMTVALVIVALALGRPNPLSFGGAHDDRFDPTRPGIVGVFRHPILVALALWAGSHIVPNGDLAHVLLFGAFLVMAIGGMAVIDRRKRRLLGADAWRRYAAARPKFAEFLTAATAARVAAAFLAQAALIELHVWFAGVAAA